MNQPGLPLVRGTGNSELDRFCQNAKQTLDNITGQARNRERLQPLAPTATLAEVIEQVNEIIRRMQG